MNSDSLIESGGDGGILSIVWGARRLMLALATPLFLWTLFSGQGKPPSSNS